MPKTLEISVPTDQLYEMLNERISFDGRPIDPISFNTYLRLGSDYWRSRIDRAHNYVSYPTQQALRYRDAHLGDEQTKIDFCDQKARVYSSGAIRALVNGNYPSYLQALRTCSNWLTQRDHLAKTL